MLCYIPIMIRERGPQNFMASNHFIEREFERRLIQVSAQMQGASNIVDRVLRIQLFDQPQPLLR